MCRDCGTGTGADAKHPARVSLMKKAFRLAIRLMWRDARAALVYVVRWHRKHRHCVLLAAMAGVLVLYLLHPLDNAVMDAARAPADVRGGTKWLAQELSYYGDFIGFNLVTFFMFQCVGWMLRSRAVMRMATASIIGCTLAGCAANVLRFATGRPRPSANVADGFYGPHWTSSMQSFPSAHTATAFGGALPVLLAKPVLGLPLTIIAGGVGWSRLHLNRHHLSDLLASMMISFAVALPLSRWTLRASLAPVRQPPGATDEEPSHVFASARQLQ